MATASSTAVKLADDAIRFEIRDGMRRVSCVVLNKALEAAAGSPELSAPMLRRRSFDRFRRRSMSGTMWAILAFAKLGQGSKAASLFGMLNPINHASTEAGAERYKVEPFVAAADIYSVAPHVGRGGWTWYTGSAGLMYRAGIEGVLAYGARELGS